MKTKTNGISLSFVWGIRLRLRAEGDKLRAEGDKLWAEAILELYGNITSQWENGNCTLATGEIFNND